MTTADLDPLPTTEWRPVSSEWARRQAREATAAAIRAAREKRTHASGAGAGRHEDEEQDQP